MSPVLSSARWIQSTVEPIIILCSSFYLDCSIMGRKKKVWRKLQQLFVFNNCNKYSCTKQNAYINKYKAYKILWMWLIFIICGHMYIILHTYMHAHARTHIHTHAYMSVPCCNTSLRHFFLKLGFFHWLRLFWPMPVAARSKALVYGCSHPEIAVSYPAGRMMSASWECCVFSGRGLCEGPITRPEESYPVYSLWV